jgi:uncharacterized membrane protein
MTCAKLRMEDAMVRAILAVLIVVVVVAIAAVATNFVSIRTSGELRAPTVSMQGGEVPTVAVDTKKVVLETREKSVEVPKVETQTTNVEVPVVRTQER